MASGWDEQKYWDTNLNAYVLVKVVEPYSPPVIVRDVLK